jgi:putative hydrolase of HD superfamily
MDDTGTNWERIARFLFEGSMLKHTWRTGYPFLGKGRESVAAHTFGVILSAMMLARDIPGVDLEKLLKLCLVHDLPEARTGDANAVHKRYLTIDEKSAIAEMIQGLPGGKEIADLLSEFSDCKTTEAVLAHDADQLDMLLSLKEHLDTGSRDAALWIPHVKDRLKSERAKALAGAILKEHWASWWMRQLLGENAK